ncbi:MAG: PIG-L deacetylase family protein [Hyphomonadaceae bacterium]
MRRAIHFFGLRFAQALQPRRASAPRRTIAALMAAAARARPASLQAVTGGGPVIVIAPHPDDETLGCGGLLAACAEAGVEARVFILADGGLSHPGSRAAREGRLASKRAREAVQALAALGLPRRALTTLALRDGGLLFDRAGLAHAAATIARQARALGAKRLLVSWRHDPHPDHIAASLCADLVAAQAPRLAVLHYPIRGRLLPGDIALSDARWAPLAFDVRRHLPAKRRAMAAYATQTAGAVADAAVSFGLSAGDLAAFLGPREIYFSTARR